MRIDYNYGPQSAAESDRTKSQNSPVANGPSPESLSAEDHAQLSGARVHVAALAAQASQLPEVRQERVQALRDAVQSGRYRTDAKKVAGAMVADMLLGPAA